MDWSGLIGWELGTTAIISIDLIRNHPYIVILPYILGFESRVTWVFEGEGEAEAEGGCTIRHSIGFHLSASSSLISLYFVSCERQQWRNPMALMPRMEIRMAMAS